MADTKDKAQRSPKDKAPKDTAKWGRFKAEQAARNPDLEQDIARERVQAPVRDKAVRGPKEPEPEQAAPDPVPDPIKDPGVTEVEDNPTEGGDEPREAYYDRTAGSP